MVGGEGGIMVFSMTYRRLLRSSGVVIARILPDLIGQGGIYG